MMKHAMRRLGLGRALAVTGLLAMGAMPAHAFGLSGIGGKIGFANPDDLESTTMWGAHAEFERPGSRLHLMPNVMYWNEDGVRDLSANFDVYHHFGPEGTVTPYLGAGVGMNFYDFEGGGDETDLGFNVMGGLKLPGPSSHYFIEGRYSASEFSQFALLGGVTFHMH